MYSPDRCDLLHGRALRGKGQSFPWKISEENVRMVVRSWYSVTVAGRCPSGIICMGICGGIECPVVIFIQTQITRWSHGVLLKQAIRPLPTSLFFTVYVRRTVRPIVCSSCLLTCDCNVVKRRICLADARRVYQLPIKNDRL